MASWPTDPALYAELLLSGAWVDITSYVQQAGGATVDISRGKSSEQSAVGPSSASARINNRDGRFSLRNPSSPYYGILTRNTQIRFTKLELGLAPTGTPTVDDFEGRTEVDLWGYPRLAGGFWGQFGGDWVDASVADGFGKLTLTNTNAARWMTLPTPAVFDIVVGVQTAALATGASLKAGPIARIQNPSSGWYAACLVFNTAGDLDLELQRETSAGVISTVTSDTNTGLTHVVDTEYKVRFRGVGTSLKAKCWLASGAEPAAWNIDTTDSTVTLADGLAGVMCIRTTSNTNANAVFSFTSYDSLDIVRFTGEVPEWPTRWDVTGTDIWSEIEAAGLLRRLSRTATPLKSAIYRAATAADQLQYLEQYWPVEEETQAREISSAHSGMAMRVSNEVNFASYADFLGSKPLPILTATAQFNGMVNRSYADGSTAFRGVYFMPTVGAVDGATLVEINTTGSAQRFRVLYSAGGGLRLQALQDVNGTPTQIDTTGVVDNSALIHGFRFLMSVEMVQDGADIDVLLFIRKIRPDNTMDEDETSFQIDTFTGLTVGRATSIRVGPGLTDCAVGHLMLGNNNQLVFGIKEVLVGNAGETAAERIERLCAEEEIFCTIMGDPASSIPVGPQRPVTLPQLLEDAAKADDGHLFEPREFVGIAYRPRAHVHNQSPTLTLDYSLTHLSESLVPRDDDSSIRNDVTVKRDQGASGRVVRESGPMSVLPPPNGVGRYDEEFTLNLDTDDQTLHAAGWHRHLGTWDEARYPAMAVWLQRSVYTSDISLTRQAYSVDIGDLIKLNNPPAWLPPDPIQQIALGYVEHLGRHRHEIRWNTVPGEPYNVWVVGSQTLGRVDGTDESGPASLLAAALDTTSTSFEARNAFSVASGGDDPERMWTTDNANFPFDIQLGPERLTVTDIAPSLVTFGSAGTVTHAVNANVTPGTPASIAVGDLLLCLAAIRNSGTGVPDTPTGWARLAAFPSTSNVQVFARVATGSGDTPTVSFTGGAANQDTSAQMIRLPGRWHSTSEIMPASNSTLNASAQDIITPPLAVLDEDAIVIWVGWKQDDWTSVAVVTGSGGTEIGEPDTTTGDDQGIVWDYLIKTTHGRVSESSFVVTGGASAISRSAVFSLRCDKQLWTVTRSVNTVVDSHVADDPVQLWRSPRVAL